MNELLKNPSVTLIASYLRTDLSQSQNQAATQTYLEAIQKLAQPFTAPCLKSITGTIQNGTAKRQPSGKELQVNLTPAPIHDSQVIDLTFFCQEESINPSDFADFNPQGCLLANQFHADLGQTIILYAEPEIPADQAPQNLDLDLANACVAAFLQPSTLAKAHKPTLVQQGILFGSPIFIYDNLETDPSQQCHLWVWLNRNDQTLKKYQDNSLRLLNLHLYRHKILFSFYEATRAYDAARTLNARLEADVNDFQQLLNQPTPKQLREFKLQLKEIPKIAFNLSIQSRDLNNHITTINTNLANYQQRLKQLHQDCLPKDNITFLQSFPENPGKRYQQQIQIYLDYLAPGQNVYNQMIETIRGLVEIEEAERDRSLERTIQIIGTGLGIAGVVGSSAPATLLDPKTQPQFLANTIKLLPHPLQTPFIFTCLVSLGLGVFAALMVWAFTRPKRK